MAADQIVRVKYVGSHTDGVSLDLPDGRSVTVAHGATVEVPAGPYAEGLLVAASEWQPSGKAAREVAAGIEEAAEAPAEPARKGG
jgi:hypothetical protein